MPVPEDIYKMDVDFTSLALKYPEFAKRLKSNRQLDFSDPESVRQLTKSLLHRDFNLKIDLPDDRLCPPVPNRFNYILFIRRLLASTTPTRKPRNSKPSISTPKPQPRPILLLDIGTGASAIYPLLGTQQYPNWYFLATELDAKSRSYALRNITQNSLSGRIKLIDTDSSGSILIPDLTPYLPKRSSGSKLTSTSKLDILLTNPPFYTSPSDLAFSASSKSRPPNSSCTGSAVEMIVAGGEVGFVTRLIRESTFPRNRSRIRWFSSMLGKLSSVGQVVEVLRERGCGNYAVTEFVQGQKTRRWCVAWSWGAWRTSLDVGRGGAGRGVDRVYLPVATEVDIGMGVDMVSLKMVVEEELRGLGVEVWRDDDSEDDDDNGKGIDSKIYSWRLFSIDGDVWSRKARRMKQQQQQLQREKTINDDGGAAKQIDQVMKDADQEEDDSEEEEDDEDEDEDQNFGKDSLMVRISLRISSSVANVHIRWIKGHDALVFESFCGWLKRRLDGRARGPGA
ncbi:hypothetical protein PV10_01678 [Exophiala mesophila]|uniref:U6 small nuclear RNA (adenine-(43)-N(6))-methyltransferase n=1 Tax=Exophiala mesophila TaxID=212818 RepID=A0A0D2AGF8_EXOME|nr:uncharacterized protein PV10_01678 [Exophiala mesophila]KIV97983.1 hypothetical protein PV10_01678 [Exophiala mesophila]